MSAPLIEALRAMDDRLSFHMPGHKGREGILPLRAHMDVTELNVTDDLYHAEGPILAAQRLMAKSARGAYDISDKWLDMRRGGNAGLCRRAGRARDTAAR